MRYELTLTRMCIGQRIGAGTRRMCTLHGPNSGTRDGSLLGSQSEGAETKETEADPEIHLRLHAAFGHGTVRVVPRPGEERGCAGTKRDGLDLVAVALRGHVRDRGQAQNAASDAARERHRVWRRLGLVRFEVGVRGGKCLRPVQRAGAGDNGARGGLILK